VDTQPTRLNPAARTSIGSKDRKLYKKLVAENAGEFGNIDALDADDDEDVEEIDLGKTGQSLGAYLRNSLLGMMAGKPQSPNVRLEPDENDPFFKEFEKRLTDKMKQEFPDVNLDADRAWHLRDGEIHSSDGDGEIGRKV